MLGRFSSKIIVWSSEVKINQPNLQFGVNVTVKYLMLHQDRWCLDFCIYSYQVEEFIPGDGVICDLGERLTKLDGPLF